MEHFLVLSYLAAFGAGILAATVAYQLYREERLSYLCDYFHYLVLMSLIVAGHLVASYVIANVTLPAYFQGLTASRLGFNIIGFILVATLVYKLIAVMRGLLDRALSLPFRVAFVAGTCLLVLGFLGALWLIPGGFSRHIDGLALFVYSSLTATAIVAMLVTLQATGSVVDQQRRRITRRFCGIHLAIYLLLPLTGTFPGPLSRHILSICFMVLSLVPLFFLKRFLQERRASVFSLPEDSEAMDCFLSRFGLSRREKDVVHLILAGKTNAEIGETLFISPNTVKNHIYNIFRKTSVQSRMQLANLIRSSTRRPADPQLQIEDRCRTAAIDMEN
ncbi:MAG: hypothetical protein BMS9Abin37_0552 [Acidobacteriota bacterium]|nr:MAG: hypothetical protein BMS9Abin37_0552 [Acidobacteriota bacterium]